MEKYLKILIPITIVTIAILWIFFPELNWEPYTIIAGTVIGLITALSGLNRNRKLKGIWYCKTVGDDNSIVEAVHIYDKKNELGFFATIKNIPIGISENQINVACKGSYKMSNENLLHNYERHHVLSSNGVPPAIIDIAVRNIYQHADKEIISINRNHLKLKSNNGVTREFTRMKDNIYKVIVDECFP